MARRLAAGSGAPVLPETAAIQQGGESDNESETGKRGGGRPRDPIRVFFDELPTAQPGVMSRHVQCKLCHRSVENRVQRMYVHKAKSCPAISAEERQAYDDIVKARESASLKRKSEAVTVNSGHHRKLLNTADSPSGGRASMIASPDMLVSTEQSSALLRWMAVNKLSWSIFQGGEWERVRATNALAGPVADRHALSGPLLDMEASMADSFAVSRVNGSGFLTLALDTRTNTTGTTITNVILGTDNGPVLFDVSISDKPVSQELYETEFRKALDDLGERRLAVVGLVSDASIKPARDAVAAELKIASVDCVCQVLHRLSTTMAEPGSLCGTFVAQIASIAAVTRRPAIRATLLAIGRIRSTHVRSIPQPDANHWLSYLNAFRAIQAAKPVYQVLEQSLKAHIDQLVAASQAGSIPSRKQAEALKLLCSDPEVVAVFRLLTEEDFWTNLATACQAFEPIGLAMQALSSNLANFADVYDQALMLEEALLKFNGHWEWNMAALLNECFAAINVDVAFVAYILSPKYMSVAHLKRLRLHETETQARDALRNGCKVIFSEHNWREPLMHLNVWWSATQGSAAVGAAAVVPAAAAGAAGRGRPARPVGAGGADTRPSFWRVEKHGGQDKLDKLLHQVGSAAYWRTFMTAETDELREYRDVQAIAEKVLSLRPATALCDRSFAQYSLPYLRKYAVSTDRCTKVIKVAWQALAARNKRALPEGQSGYVSASSEESDSEIED